jgi:hypothetical protein
MNRCDTFPFLPEHLQQIAMLVTPLDIVSMASVQFSWQQALCVPHFVSLVLVHHPAWPPWLSLFIKNNILSSVGQSVNWYNMLPVLEVASRGLDALRSLPGKTPLVQNLVECAIECILVPTPGCSDLPNDSNYWIRVLNCQLWACARNKFWLMQMIWEKYVKNPTPFDAFFEWTTHWPNLYSFKKKVLNHCTNNQLDWNSLVELSLLDPFFFPDGGCLIFYLIDFPATLKPGMVNVDIVCQMLLEYEDDWDPPVAFEKGEKRSAQQPEEGWLWDKVLPLLKQC